VPDIPFTNSSYYTVEIENKQVGRFSECSGLSVEYETYSYAEGGLQDHIHVFRGHRRYPNIVLKKGVTNENKLLEWLLGADNRDRRGTITIKLLDARGQALHTWAFAGAVPIRWEGPSLGAGRSAVASEVLEIAHAGLVT
jgi:phage tail-like protein